MLNIDRHGSAANDVCIFCMRFGRIIPSICAHFAPRKRLIVRHYTMRGEDLTAICDRTEKKTKPEYHLGVSFGKPE